VNPNSSVTIQLDGALAGPAYRLGEQSEYIAYATARAVDRPGAGEVPFDSLLVVLSEMFSTRQARRVLKTPNRYYRMESNRVVLSSSKSIIRNLPADLRWTRTCCCFAIADLNTPARRGAALVSAALAGTDAPRSNLFLSRFIGVDRKTVAAWSKDRVISERILKKVPNWTVANGNRLSLANSWICPAPSGRGSVRLQAALRSRLMRKPEGATGTEGLRRKYFQTPKGMYQELTRVKAEVGLNGLRRAIDRIGSLQLKTRDGYRQFDSSVALAFLGLARTDHPTINAKREEKSEPAIAGVVRRNVTATGATKSRRHPVPRYGVSSERSN
jgi:hypothetical protein